jgi:hypothetical protein
MACISARASPSGEIEKIVEARALLGGEIRRCSVLRRLAPRRFPRIRRKPEQAAGEHAAGVQALGGSEIQHKSLVRGKAPLLRLGQSLLDQAAFADAGLAAQHDHPTAPLLSARLEQVGQQAAVGLAADEGSGRAPEGIETFHAPADDGLGDAFEACRGQGGRADPALELALQPLTDHHLAGPGEAHQPCG